MWTKQTILENFTYNLAPSLNNKGPLTCLWDTVKWELPLCFWADQVTQRASNSK